MTHDAAVAVKCATRPRLALENEPGTKLTVISLGVGLDSEIRPVNVLLCEQFLRRALGNDSPLIEHISARRKVERRGHVLFDQQNGSSFCIDATDGDEQLDHDGRREAE